MTKVVDWNQTFKGPKRKLGGSHASGRDMLAKARERHEREVQAKDLLAKAQPAMEALLKTRLLEKTSLIVKSHIAFLTSEMKTDYDQIWSDQEGGWVDDKDSPRGSYFVDVQKVINPGTELVLKSLDHNLQEFIFHDQNQEEVVIPYSAKQSLMISTNIFEDVQKFINNLEGE
jgi:hypothetical protein